MSKFDIDEYLRIEEERKKQEELEEMERDMYDSEYWYYNPHEDAGDRV